MKPNNQGFALQWSDALATGLAVVDEQHQQLIEIYNRAVLAQAGDSQGDAHHLLDELLNYTKYHFREESSLMQQWDIEPSHCEAHLRAHESFVAFLKKAQLVARNHPADITIDILAFLAQWLLHHIAGVDARMGREILALQDKAANKISTNASAIDHSHEKMIDVVSQLSDALGQKTFDLLDQQQKILDLQSLYRALLMSGDTLVHSRCEREMLASLCSKLTQDTPFHTVWVGRPGLSGVFDVLALAGDGAQQVEDSPPRLTDDARASVVVQAWTRKQTVVCNDALADPDLAPWHAGFAQHQWLSILALPLIRNQEVWAVLAFAAARRDAFDERTLEVCTRISALIGFGLDEIDLKARIRVLQEQEARMARTDALTGLPNRLAFDEYFSQALARTRRRGTTLVVGMLDLDDFKPVNDRFGHAVGDMLLRDLAQALRERLRETDYLARLGGDEFVVLFEDLSPGHDDSELGAMLDRLHSAVEVPFDLGESRSAKIGMTLGLACYPGDGGEADALLRAADVAMYACKARKGARDRWWEMRLAGLDRGDLKPIVATHRALQSGASTAPISTDRVGPGAVVEDIVGAFFEGLGESPAFDAILRRLSANQLDQLKRAQESRLIALLAQGKAGQGLA